MSNGEKVYVVNCPAVMVCSRYKTAGLRCQQDQSVRDKRCDDAQVAIVLLLDDIKASLAEKK